MRRDPDKQGVVAIVLKEVEDRHPVYLAPDPTVLKQGANDGRGNAHPVRIALDGGSNQLVWYILALAG